jgi:hypothetical protein
VKHNNSKPKPTDVSARRPLPLWLAWVVTPWITSQVGLAQGNDSLADPIRAAVENRVKECSEPESFLARLGLAKDPDSEPKLNKCSPERDLFKSVRDAADQSYQANKYNDEEFRRNINTSESVLLTEAERAAKNVNSEEVTAARFSQKTGGDNKPDTTVITVKGYRTISD